MKSKDNKVDKNNNIGRSSNVDTGSSSSIAFSKSLDIKNIAKEKEGSYLIETKQHLQSRPSRLTSNPNSKEIKTKMSSVPKNRTNSVPKNKTNSGAKKTN